MPKTLQETADSAEQLPCPLGACLKWAPDQCRLGAIHSRGEYFLTDTNRCYDLLILSEPKSIRVWHWVTFAQLPLVGLSALSAIGGAAYEAIATMWRTTACGLRVSTTIPPRLRFRCRKAAGWFAHCLLNTTTL